MSRSRASIAGPIFIVVGVLMLLSQLGWHVYGSMWPMFLLAVGAGMWIRWFQTRDDSGLVFTGTLLLLLGCLFQFDQWFGLYFHTHWPYFVLAPGISMCVMASVDDRKRDAFVPGSILIAVACGSYFFSLGFVQWLFRAFFRLFSLVFRVALPVGLIAWGVWLVMGRRGRLGGSRSAAPDKVEPPFSSSPPEEEANFEADED